MTTGPCCPAAYRDIVAHTFVFKDAQIGADNHIVQRTATTPIDSNAADRPLVNGQLRPTLTLRPDQTELWRLAQRRGRHFYRLQLDGYQFTVIGEDGVPVAGGRTADTLLMPPGKRYDVLVTADGEAGRTWLRTTAYSNGPREISTLTPSWSRWTSRGTASPAPVLAGAIPTAPADLANAPIAQAAQRRLCRRAPTVCRFYINGKQST